MNIGLIKLYNIIYGVCIFTVTVRYSVGQFGIQILKVVYRSNIFTQHYLWGLSIHCYSSLFARIVRYSNRKAKNIGLLHLYSILYGVCLFTITVRYSVVQFVIQIVRVMNMALIYLYSISYGVCLFTLTVRYSVDHLVIQIKRL